MTLDILIGCEESQTVCLAFRALGHNAFSNDLKPSSGGSPQFHLQMDVIEAIQSRKWHFIGLHPTCTAIALSGNRTYAAGMPKYQDRLEAVKWTIDLWQLACEVSDHVYMENPMGAMNSNSLLPKPQIIHPYFFGDSFQKTTCLWLHNLPKLKHIKTTDLFDTATHVDKGEMTTFDSGAVMPTWYADAWKLPKAERATLRSKTFPGIAQNMASQWTEYLLKHL